MAEKQSATGDERVSPQPPRACTLAHACLARTQCDADGERGDGCLAQLGNSRSLQLLQVPGTSTAGEVMDPRHGSPCVV